MHFLKEAGDIVFVPYPYSGGLARYTAENRERLGHNVGRNKRSAMRRMKIFIRRNAVAPWIYT
jgi:hypothetical protein